MSPELRAALAQPRKQARTVLDIARSAYTPTEKQVEHMGDRLMATYGFDIVRFSQARATMQTEGIPDRRYYHRERKLAVWWEAKAPKGKQRPKQAEFQRMCEAVGEVYVLGTHDALAAWLTQHFTKAA